METQNLKDLTLEKFQVRVKIETIFDNKKGGSFRHKLGQQAEKKKYFLSISKYFLLLVMLYEPKSGFGVGIELCLSFVYREYTR